MNVILYKNKGISMEKIEYLVLLRGINVGGNNIIRMNELKELFEKMNFIDVITYIQSGNIIFKDIEKDKIKITNKIEKVLFKKLNSKINIVILTFSEVKQIINNKPECFGDDKTKYKYDVIFLKEPLKAEDAIKEFKPRDGVDKIYSGKKVLYISRLMSEWTKSHFSKISESSIYQNITIRNWNTTEKIYELMDKA
jgi:uncharacterized protein (DUF1697 family)